MLALTSLGLAGLGTAAFSTSLGIRKKVTGARQDVDEETDAAAEPLPRSSP